MGQISPRRLELEDKVVVSLQGRALDSSSIILHLTATLSIKGWLPLIWPRWQTSTSHWALGSELN